MRALSALAALSLSTSTAIAFTCAERDRVQVPHSTCSITYEVLGFALKLCSGVLISPSQVLTTRTCVDNTLLLQGKITCGTDMPIDEKTVTKDPAFKFAETYDILKKDQDDNARHNMAVITLNHASKMIPAKVELDSAQFLLSECFVAGGGDNDELKRNGTLKACKLNEYGKFDKSQNLLGSELISEVGDLGGPLYCKNSQGDYVVRAIHNLNNVHTSFYERLDADRVFLDPILSLKASVPASAPSVTASPTH